MGVSSVLFNILADYQKEYSYTLLPVADDIPTTYTMPNVGKEISKETYKLKRIRYNFSISNDTK